MEKVFAAKLELRGPQKSLKLAVPKLCSCLQEFGKLTRKDRQIVNPPATSFQASVFLQSFIENGLLHVGALLLDTAR